MATNYSPSIVKDGLVLHLDAASPKSYASGSVVWYDLSKNGVNGALTNGPTFDSSNAGNITFDGSNDYVNFGTYSPNINTVDVWFKLYGTNSIVCLGNDANDSSQWSWSIFRYINSLYIRGNPGGMGSISIDVSNILSKWTNVVMIRRRASDSKCAAYINGKFYNSSNDSTLTDTYPNLRIGKGGTNYTSMSLSCLRLYNRELSESEIFQNYNATKGRFNL
jgi:hypothetical protein